MREIAPEHIPVGVDIEWSGPANDRVVDMLQFQGGAFEVNHQLPDEVETIAVLHASGVTATAIAQSAELSLGNVSRRIDAVGKTFGLAKRPKHPTMPALVGRLCLPGSILECVDPIPVTHEPDTTCLETLRHLGEGNDWAETAAIMGKTARSLAWHLRQNYYPMSTKKQGLNVSSMLLYAYGSDLFLPEAIVRQQPGDYPSLPLERLAFYDHRAMRPLKSRNMHTA